LALVLGVIRSIDLASLLGTVHTATAESQIELIAGWIVCYVAFSGLYDHPAMADRLAMGKFAFFSLIVDEIAVVTPFGEKLSSII